ncbi:Histone H [Heracleum sosnowskyi]|uniref:Histone H n=1 Tax=Heracleum sosnowskyi TaxID=360622 RepID=A0AAD8H2L1_9APIA|nr:Histone H [Heracleum sosnowskyi]
MATSVEASKAAAEPPKTVVSEKKRTKPAAKPVKEKKAKVSKPKPAKTASHPTYFEMIKEAISALKERGGSSPYAIAKYMEDKHKAVLPANFRKILGLQLKNCATKGKLTKVKASYKISELVKAPKVEKKVEKPKKTVAAKAKPVKKPEAVKKAKTKAVAPAVKKTKKRAAPPAKAKAKQPKSIKSPAAKKAKKAVA